MSEHSSADSSPAGDSLWRAVYQVRAGRGGGTDRQACAAERFQVGAGRRAFPRKRPAGAALDTCDILLINKANTASATNAHRVLTNTTGVIGGMAEAIIPNLCPWWIPSRGFLLLNPHQDRKRKDGSEMVVTMEIDGQLVRLDLGNLVGSEVVAKKESERKEEESMEIRFESEGYHFSVDLAGLAAADSIEEIENQVICWQEEEPSIEQSGG